MGPRKPFEWLTVAVVAPLLFGGCATGVGSRSHARLVARIDSIAEKAIDEGPLAGLAISVTRWNDTLLASGYGYADLDRKIPAGPNTIFPIASITKQITAVAVLQLAERGQLQLNDEITEYLPDYPTGGHKIEIEHLLTHTSGIRSFTSLGDTWALEADPYLPHDAMVELFANEPFDFPPGESFLYSNSGYYLLGLIIERVSGQSYADYVREHIFEPLGMRDSGYCDDEPNGRTALGHVLDGGSLVRVQPTGMSHLYAAGSLCSTVLDLLTWTRSLRERKLMNALSYRRMTTPVKLKDGSEASYGYGLLLGELGGRRMIGHGGGIEGFATQLSYYPDRRVTVAVLANAEHARTRPIAETIARWVLGIPEPDVKDRPLEPEELPRYPGDYDLRDGVLHVFEQDGEILARFGQSDPIRLRYQGADVFVAESDATMELRFVVSRGRARKVVLTIADLSLDADRIAEITP